MSVKRQATNELNHENWDQEDPEEHEEMGSFKSATKDILEKRVIRTAKRRAPVSGGEAKKSVFSGFGGFNKTQPSSFDFLANLTNGSTNANGTPNKNETSVTSSLFSSKSPISSTGSSVFGTQETTTSNKPNFGIPMSQTSSLFGGSLATSTALTGFTATKADSTVGDTPFKIQPVSSSADTKTTNANSNASPSQVSSTIFGIPSTSANTNKSLFSTNSNSSPLKIQPVSSTTTTVATGFGIMTKAASNTTISENKVEAKNDEKRMKYYSKLKGLNGCVSDWIKKHVEETPLCILSPIFKDYEKYLKEIQDEFHSPEKGESNKLSDTKSTPAETMILENVTSSKSTSANSNNSVKTVFNAEPTSKPSVLGTQSNAINKPSFSFGINTNSTSSSTNTTTTNTGFSFGTTSPQVTTANTSTSFSFGTNTNTATTNGTAPFSFGIGKPFTFNSNIQSNSEKTNNENEDEEEPPKVEFTPVVEENTVFEKRCKIFVKKDGNFADKGVGTLYIKKIAESGKHQLLVRANTSLGNILINLILASAIPTQRMGKNNIMMVCIPTPDSKPPPTPVLIRVKTSEEADDLLNTLNKYKL